MRIRDWSSDVCSSDLREALCDPAEREEGARDAGIGENLEYGIAIGLDPAFERRPVGAADRPLKGADLEPILDLDRQAVPDRKRVETGKSEYVRVDHVSRRILKKKKKIKQNQII